MINNIQFVGKVSLKQIRNLTGMSQKEFADYVEIPLTSYCRYERNIGKAPFASISNICDKLKVNISQLEL